MPDQIERPALLTGLLRLAVRLLLIFAFAAVVLLVMEWILDKTSAMSGENLNMMVGVLALLLLAYSLVIAVPFVPGIEIGLSLLLLRGAEIAPFVYMATVLGLMLAFGAGRWLPYNWLHATFADLRMRSACTLIEKLEPLDRPQRLAVLKRLLPDWAAPLALKGRYLLLAALINLPGNSLIGGGGGLTFVAGFSRLFDARITALTIALAVMPVPLAVWVFGIDILGGISDLAARSN